MHLEMLKSKIHKARITEAQLDYEGSFTIDRDLMDLVGLVPYERILVSNMNNGQRFETYVIEGPRHSRTFCLNGATARLGLAGDLVTIFAFAQMTPEEAKTHKPKIATLDENNSVTKMIGGDHGE
ncbi:aspartate 1-decarboxylase [candidate division KSB1 bacterium]